MKRKIIITFLCLTMGLSIVACGNKASTTPSTEKATESVTKTTTETVADTSNTETAHSTNNKDNKSDATTSSVPESESWPEYKETMTYLLDNNLADSQYVKMLNPDIYGTETVGKATYEFSEGTCTPDIGEYVKTLDLTTTKGYKIWAYWYVETNTVQYVYTGEVSPWGGWMEDDASADVLDTYAESKYGSIDYMNLTHQDKIDALGTPAMTDDEVVAAIKTQYGM